MAVAKMRVHDAVLAEFRPQPRERLVRQIGIALRVMRKQPALFGRGRTAGGRDAQRHDAGRQAKRFEPQADEREQLHRIDRRRRRPHPFGANRAVVEFHLQFELEDGVRLLHQRGEQRVEQALDDEDQTIGVRFG